MPDPRFFSVSAPKTLNELAAIGDAAVAGDGGPERLIRDVAPLDVAGPDDLGFVDNPRYVEAFRRSRAGACVVHPDRVGLAPAGMGLLVTATPYLAYARMARAFYPEEAAASGVDDRAIVHPSASIGEGTGIAAGAVVGPRAEIGRRCVVAPNAVIGPGVVIGDDCRIGPSSSVYFCLMGNRVRLYAGVRIGDPGFGFASGPAGHETVPQLGRVIVGDDTEIGSNTTIDRGAGPDTVIGAGCRIDNLVQIGHNVRLGRGCIIVSQTGISGSSVLEDFVVTGGQVGVAGHLTIGKGARIGAQAGVMRNIPAGARMGGSPAVTARQFMRQVAILNQLARKKADRDG